MSVLQVLLRRYDFNSNIKYHSSQPVPQVLLRRCDDSNSNIKYHSSQPVPQVLLRRCDDSNSNIKYQSSQPVPIVVLTRCDSNIKYHCAQCSYSSQWGFAFNAHKKRCHRSIYQDSFHCFEKMDGYECKICSCKTGLRLQLFQHQKRNRCTLLPSEYVKTEIKHGFIEQEPLDIKFETHEFGGEGYQCVCCGLVTFSQLFLINHLTSCKATKVGERNPDCGSNLKQRHNEKGKMFNRDNQTKSKSYLKRRLTNKHLAKDKSVWFKCKDCVYKTQRKDNLKEHQLLNHASNDEIKWFQCHICEFQAKTKRYLKRHLTMHRTVENEVVLFECEYCVYKTQYKFDLKEHQLHNHASNDKIKWLKCHNCNYEAKSEQYLKRHLTMHH